MFFSSKQLDEKNRIIQKIEVEKDDLYNKLINIEAENTRLVQVEIDLRKTIVELTEKVQRSSIALKNSQAQLEQQRRENEKNICVLEEKHKNILEQETLIQSLDLENNVLMHELDFYKKMTPETYIKLGTDLFTLEKLTELLQKAQSSSFILLQKLQKKKVLQSLIYDIQALMCPIRTDGDLLNLLWMIGNENKEIEQIRKKLDSVTVGEVLKAKSIDKKQYILQKTITLPVMREKAYSVDIMDEDDYMRKIALSRFVTVLKEIAN